ncbi:hypothetical protein [Nafulsella turpanensis]|uniref:hypothetical protein n=1 Tax=Nafulsella turpanensis TaxID=1265690 RepID=UPI00034B39BB|nr:hypothetical protein [Nafulsella turpanensis]
MKAHNPKLDIYKIYLRPTDSDNNKTFKNLLISKLYGSIDESNWPDNSAIFQDLLEAFINEIDADDFILDERASKAFTAYDTDQGAELSPIKIHSNQFILEGIVEGGRYNQRRGKSAIGAKDDKEYLDNQSVILDHYYFFLYLPFDHNIGIFMVQSYTQDHIRDSFQKFLRDFLATEGFYKIKFDSYCPEQIIEQYKSGSVVKKFSFTSDVLLNELSNSPADQITEEFTIKIEAKSATGHNFTLDYVGRILNLLRGAEFNTGSNTKSLEEFNTRVFLENTDTEKGAFYDISRGLDIKPTIYLENRIQLDQNGIPDFQELKQFCFNLLNQILIEIRPEDGIIER